MDKDIRQRPEYFVSNFDTFCDLDDSFNIYVFFD